MPDKSTIRNELLVFIKDLLEKRTKLAKLTRDRVLADLSRLTKEKELVMKEAKIALEVCSERDEKDKLVYSNEAVRRAEILNRLARDEAEKGSMPEKKGDKRKTRKPSFNEINNAINRKRRFVAETKSDEGVLSAEIKNLESLERLYFIDLEAKE